MPQVDLSHHQRCILETACARPDGELFPIMQNLKGGAVGNICKSLLSRHLVEETPASSSKVVWRYDAALGPVSLRVTNLAHAALGLKEGDVTPPYRTHDRYVEFGAPKQSPAETIMAMMQRPEGVSMKEMTTETGWQAHSIRGLISGVLRKKQGLLIETVRDAARGAVYRITQT